MHYPIPTKNERETDEKQTTTTNMSDRMFTIKNRMFTMSDRNHVTNMNQLKYMMSMRDRMFTIRSPFMTIYDIDMTQARMCTI